MPKLYKHINHAYWLHPLVRLKFIMIWNEIGSLFTSPNPHPMAKWHHLLNNLSFLRVFWDPHLCTFPYHFSQFSSIKCIHTVVQPSLLSLKLFHHLKLNFILIISSNASFSAIIPASVTSILISVSMNLTYLDTSFN